MRIYRGTVPTLACRDVSGQDCDRPFPAGADNCGIDSHVPQVGLNVHRGSPQFIKKGGPPRVERRHKPKLTVNEDYDLVGPSRDLEDDLAQPDLDPDSFDSSQVWVGVRVQAAFTQHHNTDAETAISEIRMLVGEALENGKYRRMDSGFHFLTHEKFEVILTPDGEAVTAYSTWHFERTPSQVFSGVPSRFKRGSKKGSRYRTPEEEEARQRRLGDLQTGEIVRGPIRNVVNFGIFVDLGGVDGLVHSTEFPEGIVGSPQENFEIDQEVTVQVLTTDTETARVGLTMRFDGATPWPGQPQPPRRWWQRR